MKRHYYDTRIQKVRTEIELQLCGLSLSSHELHELGIFPIEYLYLDHDPDTQTMLPVGGPKPKDADPNTYIQEFEVVDRRDDYMIAKMTEYAEAKRKEALAAADEAVSGYMSLFSDIEKTTWTSQEAEVTAWLADNEAPTPTLDALAQARGIEREVMLEKAAAKVMAFKQLAPFIIGRQQSYEDAIKAIIADETKTLAERVVAVREMSFDYSDILSMAGA